MTRGGSRPIAWDPNNPKGLPRPLPLAPFIPDPLPYPEPVEPYTDPVGVYSWPRLDPWLYPLGSYSPLPLSAREPMSSSYLGFGHSQDWETLVKTPLPRQPALFPGERRVDGMRSWMDATHIDGHAGCDGLCPWCSNSRRRSLSSRLSWKSEVDQKYYVIRMCMSIS
jgi:hypothetical protein